MVEDHGETDEEKEEKKKADEAQRKVEEDKAVKQMERLPHLRLAFGRCPKYSGARLSVPQPPEADAKSERKTA